MAGKPKYTNDELEKKVEEYFEKCEGEMLTDENGEIVYNKYGQPVIIKVHPPTMTGLARSCDFKSRQALLNYKARSIRAAEILDKAKMRVEEYAEERLFDRDGVQGAKFTLCNNFGWSDKQPGANEAETLSKIDALIGAIGREAER